MERMGLDNNSDNYSDEDFYSDEEIQKGPRQENDYDRDDDDFAFDETAKKGGLGEVVNYYEKYLVRQEEDESGSFDDYQPSESFKQQQERVQNAYGEDTEIYKTLNPKHSQAQIRPK